MSLLKPRRVFSTISKYSTSINIVDFRVTAKHTFQFNFLYIYPEPQVIKAAQDILHRQSKSYSKHISTEYQNLLLLNISNYLRL